MILLVSTLAGLALTIIVAFIHWHITSIQCVFPQNHLVEKAIRKIMLEHEQKSSSPWIKMVHIHRDLVKAGHWLDITKLERHMNSLETHGEVEQFYEGITEWIKGEPVTFRWYMLSEKSRKERRSADWV